MVALGRSGAAILAPVQAKTPFPLVLPAYVPPGFALAGASAAPQPPQTPHGMFLAEIAYRSPTGSLTLFESSFAGGALGDRPVTTVALTPRVSAQAHVGTAGNGAPLAEVLFTAGGHSISVVGLNVPLPTVIRIARSMVET